MSSFNKKVLERLTHLENNFKQVEDVKDEMEQMRKLLLRLNSKIDVLEANTSKGSFNLRDSPTLHPSEEHRMSSINTGINLDGMMI